MIIVIMFLNIHFGEVVAVAVVVVGFDADEVKAVVAVDAELNFRTVY